MIDVIQTNILPGSLTDYHCLPFKTLIKPESPCPPAPPPITIPPIPAPPRSLSPCSIFPIPYSLFPYFSY
ncbi:MAG: hypothetical protein EA364_01345 [Balneolaceae bacterium]|nr:MAG: hypothetical protein EA364_01345 [Balneolaceae bacterium]